jgi:hypothetical protein
MRRNFELRRRTVIHAADFEEWLRSTQSRRGKIAYRAFETDLLDGRWFWMTEAVQKSGWMLCIASDITSLRAKGRTVRQDCDQAIKAAQTDELTGVATLYAAKLSGGNRCARHRILSSPSGHYRCKYNEARIFAAECKPVDWH